MNFRPGIQNNYEEQSVFKFGLNWGKNESFSFITSCTYWNICQLVLFKIGIFISNYKWIINCWVGVVNICKLVLIMKHRRNSQFKIWNFRLGIQTIVQLWPLIKNASYFFSYLQPKSSTETPKIAKFWFSKLSFSIENQSKLSIFFYFLLKTLV